MKQRILLLLITGILGAGAGWLVTRFVLDDGPDQTARIPVSPTAQDLVGQRRPDFTLGSASGERVSASDLDGQVLLLNFWATWCEPCRAEMPMLSEIHDAYADRGFSVVGIALDDVQQAREFAGGLGIEYPILVGAADVMATGLAYGNQAGLLPYTVLVDRSGIVRWVHLGVLERADILARLEELL
jgi:peroxiredoxin